MTVVVRGPIIDANSLFLLYHLQSSRRPEMRLIAAQDLHKAVPVPSGGCQVPPRDCKTLPPRFDQL